MEPDPLFNAPGRLCASTIRSFSVWYLELAGTMTTQAPRESRLMGAKSFSGSYGRFLNRAALVERVELLPMKTVCPSAGALQRLCTAMKPLAPALFSTATPCPVISPIFRANSRAVVSVPLPGGNGTTKRSGLDGKASDASARAGQEASADATQSPANMRRRLSDAKVMLSPFLISWVVNRCWGRDSSARGQRLSPRRSRAITHPGA